MSRPKFKLSPALPSLLQAEAHVHEGWEGHELLQPKEEDDGIYEIATQTFISVVYSFELRFGSFKLG